MHIQTTETPKPVEQAEHRPDDFSFDDIRPLKRTMRAIASILSNATSNGNRTDCRLYTPADEPGVFIIASDGYRLLQARLTANAHHQRARFDEPLGMDVVRKIANTRSERIGLSIDQKCTILREGSPADPGTRFPRHESLILTAFERVLRNEGQAANVARGVDRTTAHNVMKALPKQASRDKVCRVSINNPGGLRFWGSSTKLIGPMYPPDQELAAPVHGLNKEIVFGINRRNLTATLRTMTAKVIDITVYSESMPIRITSTDGQELAILSTDRLT